MYWWPDKGKMLVFWCWMWEKGRAGNRLLTRYASSSAVAVSSSSSGGLFSWLTGERSSSVPPMQVPLQGVTLPPALPDYVEPGKTKITTLPNGVKIASETSAVCPNHSFFCFFLPPVMLLAQQFDLVDWLEPCCLDWIICSLWFNIWEAWLNGGHTPLGTYGF